MIASLFNPALTPLYAFFTLANALGALYALYWNVRASNFPPLCRFRLITSAYAFAHFVWLSVLLFAPIGVPFWLNVYFVISVTGWHFVWSKQAKNSEKTQRQYGIALGSELENEVLSRVDIDYDKDR